MKLKVKKIGNSLGATFTREMLDKLQVTEGDTLYVTETPDGIQLSTYDPDLESVMEVAEEITHRYRNALKELAR